MARIKIEIDTEQTGREAVSQLSTGGASRIHSHNPTVWVIPTIPVPAELKDQFELGLSNSSAHVHYAQNHDYKKNDIGDLITEVRAHNTASDLIVTVGGKAAYDAATTGVTKPFISLLGVKPSSRPSNFAGCVSLETIAANSDRFDLLTGKGLDPSEIGLFYNRNSHLNNDDYTDGEVDAWNSLVGTRTQALPGGNNNTGANDSAAYATDFDATKIPLAIRGLVISADPYFQNTKTLLIPAVNAWMATDPAVIRCVCYPTQAYKTATNRPTDQILIYGPDLLTGFNLLGQLATMALNGISADLTLPSWQAT
jgi:hypothetical protein